MVLSWDYLIWYIKFGRGITCRTKNSEASQLQTVALPTLPCWHILKQKTIIYFPVNQYFTFLNYKKAPFLSNLTGATAPMPPNSTPVSDQLYFLTKLHFLRPSVPVLRPNHFTNIFQINGVCLSFISFSIIGNIVYINLKRRAILFP